MHCVHPIGEIEQYNFILRGRPVILDADLAMLFDVETRRLNEQFKRASHRVPADFRFQMTQEEKIARAAIRGQDRARGVADCDINPNLKSSTRLPYVYSEHGALMAAIVLRSSKAIYTCVAMVLTLVALRDKERVRQEEATHADTVH